MDEKYEGGEWWGEARRPIAYLLDCLKVCPVMDCRTNVAWKGPELPFTPVRYVAVLDTVYRSFRRGASPRSVTHLTPFRVLPQSDV